MRSARLIVLSIAIVCAVLLPSFADQVVYFSNGKAIMAKSVEKGEKFTVLEVEGGGRIGVPTDQIVRIEDYIVSAPAVPVIAAPPVAAPPVNAAAPAAVPVAATDSPSGGPLRAAVPFGLAQAPPMVPGPGLGGRPVAGSNNNLMGMRPVGIGSDGASPALQRPSAPPNAGPGVNGGGGGMVGAGARAGMAAQRRLGRGGIFPGGRNRPGELNRGAPPAPPPVAPAPQTTAPAPVVEPVEEPPPPDDSQEDATDPPTTPEGDPSGDTPGSAR